MVSTQHNSVCTSRRFTGRTISATVGDQWNVRVRKADTQADRQKQNVHFRETVRQTVRLTEQ